MPTLNLSDLNVILGTLGLYICLYGLLSAKIKNVWYLGEALPAIVVGICFGPLAARFIVSDRWASAEPGQTSEITLGFTRVMIGIQLVIAGYQLPARYVWRRWKDMTVILLPVMTIMWLCTTGCILATIPKVTRLSAMVIAACVTSTDPVLSQAVAKGPFSDRYVARPVREIISAEAGANDGFGFPFLMLATYLIRHYDGAVGHDDSQLHHRAAEEVGRQGGGVGVAIGNWALWTMLYYVVMGAAYGAFGGTLVRFAIRHASNKKWIDTESYLLIPVAFGLFFIGSPGLVGTNDLVACFASGCALNWDGEYLSTTLKLHDELNGSVDMLLNFGGFVYLGTIFPWSEFNSDVTGITYPRLIALGFMVLFFRRIPAIMLTYKLIPNSIRDWKEALFVGYFGPIGIGAAFYVEHTRHLFPHEGETSDREVNDLLRAIAPVVYWLAFFSIVVHGLSIPVLSFIYARMGVQPVLEDAVSVRRGSVWSAAPSNAVEEAPGAFVAYNRFARPTRDDSELPDWRANSIRSRSETRAETRGEIRGRVMAPQVPEEESNRKKSKKKTKQQKEGSVAPSPIWRRPFGDGNEEANQEEGHVQWG